MSTNGQSKRMSRVNSGYNPKDAGSVSFANDYKKNLDRMDGRVASSPEVKLSPMDYLFYMQALIAKESVNGAQNAQNSYEKRLVQSAHATRRNMNRNKVEYLVKVKLAEERIADSAERGAFMQKEYENHRKVEQSCINGYKTKWSNKRDAKTSAVTGGIVGVIAGVLVPAAAFLGGFMGGEHGGETNNTKEKFVLGEEIYTIGESDGHFHSNGTQVNATDMIAKVTKQAFFDGSDIQKITEKCGSAFPYVDLYFNNDASVKATIDVPEKAFHMEKTVKAKDAHKKIYSKFAGKKPYAVLPEVADNATEAVFEIDESMLSDVSASIVGSGVFNAIKVSYNGDGNLQGQTGFYNKDTKTFGPTKSLTHKEITEALNTTVNANPDASPAVDKTLDKIKINALDNAIEAYKLAETEHGKFSAKYGAGNDTQLGQYIKDLQNDIGQLEGDINDTLNKTEQTNLTNLEGAYNKLLAMKARRDQMLQNLSKANEDAVESYVDDLNNYISALESGWNASNGTNKKEIEGWMKKVNDTIAEYMGYLTENKTKYESDIANLTNDISKLESRIKTLVKPFTPQDIAFDSVNTERFRQKFDDAYDIGCPEYLIDFSDPAQQGAMEQWLGKERMDQWKNQSVRKARIIDAEDSENVSAAIGLFDENDQLTDTIMVSADKMAEGVAVLAPYQSKEKVW